MNGLIEAFEERVAEIETYLDLLEAVERQVQTGPPKLGADGVTITAQQQRILYSSVYLQLYNLVEATITRCVDALAAAINKEGRWLPADLSIELRREWVKFTARTNREQGADARLDAAVALCAHLIDRQPVSGLRIPKGSSGNWDDGMIGQLAKRLGLPLDIPAATAAPIKRHYRNEQPPLKFIKVTRNQLGHGNISFAECGEGVTVPELRQLAKNTALYLRAVIESFEAAIDAHAFLAERRRPAQRGA